MLYTFYNVVSVQMKLLFRDLICFFISKMAKSINLGMMILLMMKAYGLGDHQIALWTTVAWGVPISIGKYLTPNKIPFLFTAIANARICKTYIQE